MSTSSPATIIYVLTNPAMPGMVKIGKTARDPEARIKELSGTNVPVPFECYFAAQVADAEILEKKLHQLFSENRVNPKREFFELDPLRVKLAICIGDATPLTVSEGDTAETSEDLAAGKRLGKKRSKIQLSAIGIKAGDVLKWCDDETVTAVVHHENDVTFEGDVMSMSRAARAVCTSRGQCGDVSGSLKWMFDGETLDERRTRLEAEGPAAPGDDA